MEKRHKTAQLICILTGIIALWSELIWPSSLWPTFLPGSAVTHGAQGQRFSSHWWLEWHAQTSRTICGDCRSSASPAIVGFCHGKHYASTMRLLQYNPWDWNFDSWIRHCRSSHVRGLVLQWGATVWVVIPASDAWFVSQLMVYMKKCTVLRKWEFRFFSEASKWSRTPQAWPSWPSPSFCSSSKTPGWPLLAGIPGTKKVDTCNGTTMIWLTKCVVRCCEEIRKRKYVSKNPKWESHENHHSKHAVKANFLGSSQLEDAKMAICSAEIQVRSHHDSKAHASFGVIINSRFGASPRSEKEWHCACCLQGLQLIQVGEQSQAVGLHARLWWCSAVLSTNWPWCSPMPGTRWSAIAASSEVDHESFQPILQCQPAPDL